MKVLKIAGHAAAVCVLLLLLVAVPVMTCFSVPTMAKEGADAVSSASLQLPDQPSGEFLVLIKSSNHLDTLIDWQSFFQDEEFVVIFDDIRCLAAEGDTAALQLASRFQAQLPENQMLLRTEDPTLLASKVENGFFDVAVFSKEMASAIQLDLTASADKITVLEITGNGD